MDFFFSILNALTVGDVMNYRLTRFGPTDSSHRLFSCTLPFRLLHSQSTIQMLALREKIYQ